MKKGVESPILTGERIRLLDALGFEWGMEERRKTVAAKCERGEGASSMTHLSRRTSLAVPSSEVDFSSLTPSRSCTPPTSRHRLANHGNGGEKQPPKASMMMIGTAEMHGQHHRHHHFNGGASLAKQNSSPLPTEISFRKREAEKGSGK